MSCSLQVLILSAFLLAMRIVPRLPCRQHRLGIDNLLNIRFQFGNHIPREFFAQLPQLAGKFPTNRPGPHPTKFSGIDGNLNRNIAIFAINAAKYVELRTCSTPHAGCGPVRASCVGYWVYDRSSVVIQHPISADLLSRHVTYEVGDYGHDENSQKAQMCRYDALCPSTISTFPLPLPRAHSVFASECPGLTI
jgi:hypothetical protein